MRLVSGGVKRALQGRGVTHLFHANSVKTACTFLRIDGLLSRGSVQARGLQQTWQPSDNLDREFGVWNDIFLDAVNIGERVHGKNNYGPVLFKINLDILDFPGLPELWVTKNNPIHWTRDVALDTNYFQTVQELDETYSIGDFGSMFTLRNTNEILPFNGYLDEIFLDAPNRGNGEFEKAIQALRDARREGGVIADIVIRDGGNSYANMSNNSFNRFYNPRA